MKKYMLVVILIICILLFTLNFTKYSYSKNNELNQKLKYTYDFLYCKPIQSNNFIYLNNIARISILIDGNRSKIYTHNNNYYIEAILGKNYILQVNNLLNRRIKVCTLVDGLDVINGKKALTDNRRGYVIEPYSTLNIKGWRISDNEVAMFKFGPIQNAYAMKMDEPFDIGTITFAIFCEKKSNDLQSDDWLPNYPVYKSQLDNNSNIKQSSKERLTTSVGTEFGEATTSKVTHVNFESESEQPNAKVKIYYLTYEELLKNGILKDKNNDLIETPKNDKSNDDYAIPPIDWKRKK